MTSSFSGVMTRDAYEQFSRIAEANVNDMNSIWIARIVDDRGYDADGPLETVEYFKEKAAARKWLANWIKEEIEDNDDEDEDKEKRKQLLSLIGAEEFDTLFKEYQEYQDEYDDGVLKLFVYQQEVN